MLTRRLAAVASWWPQMLSVGLGVFALASVAKTAPAFAGVGCALLAVVLGVIAGYRPRWDGVEVIVALLAIWLATRLLLQQFGIGEAALLRPWRDYADWTWPLTFVALGAGTANPATRVRHLWLLAMTGFALAIAGYFVANGFAPLLAGERLGFHLKRPLGVGLYAGAFLLMLLFTAPHWWHTAGRLRWPVRIVGTSMLLLFLLVLAAARNRSTWLGLAVVGMIACIALVVRAWRTRANPRRKIGAFVLGALLFVGIGVLLKGPMEARTAAESEALATLIEEGLAATPATPITIRLRIWSYVLARFPEAPLLGHGFGGLQQALERDLRNGDPLMQDERQDHVHSTYLQVVYGQGLLGCILWSTLAGFLLRDLRRAARQDAEIRRLLPAIWAVLGFTAVWALTDYRLSHPDMRFFTILLLLTLRLFGRATPCPAQV